MAVVLLFRVAIFLAPTAVRLFQSEQRSGHPGWAELVRFYHDRIFDPDEDDATLSADMSSYAGYAVGVGTFAAPFELRKVQFIWSQADQAIATEDARVVTFHLLKLTAGSPDANWIAADFTALDTAFTSWWTTLKPSFAATITWDRLKVYKAGPAIVPPQPPVYDSDKNVVATGASGTVVAPQTAVSVTEIAGTKRYWGRFYLPPPDSSKFTAYGRLNTTFITLCADATDSLYTSLRGAGLEPVVYRQPLEERETKSGTTLPARVGSAWSVEKVQVDDVADVIRRRRFKYPTLRIQRDI